MIPDLARARAQLLAACREVLQHDPGFDPLAELVLERVSELGRGGMGVVWRVTDRRLGREAALKLLLPGGDPELRPLALRRFERESRITARLDHPSIPPVFGAGTTSGGERWLLMKLIRGEPLASRLKAHDWSRDPRADEERRWLREQLEALVKVGEATAFAHGQRVVHRDLKPANVMVGRFGEVLVMDWGLAKELDRADSFTGKELAALRRPQVEADPTLTGAGTALGTPGYMPPEQVDGESAASSDVWALGAMLVAVCTGEPPVDGETGLERITATLQGRLVLPRARRPGLPPELDSIAARALALDPAARFRDAEAFVRDLRAFLAGEPVACHRYGRVEALLGVARRRPAHLVGALAGLLLLGVAGGLVLWGLASTRRAGEEARRAQVELAQGQARDEATRALGEVAATPAGARTGLALRAVGAAQRWRDLAPRDAAAAAALGSAATALGEEALAGGQWELAREALRLAAGDEPGPRAAADARVDERRLQATRERLARVSAELARLRSGALDDDPAGFEEAVDVLARWQEDEVVGLLARTLGEEAALLEQGKVGAPGAPTLRRALCRALGRLELPATVVAALGRYLAAQPDELAAVEAGLALCRAGGVEALDHVERAALGFRPGGAFDVQLRAPRLRAGRAVGARDERPLDDLRQVAERAVRRLAEGDRAGALEDCARLVASDDLAVRARGLNTRGTLRAAADDLHAAAADFSAALEADPGMALAWSNRAEVRCRLGDPRGALDDVSRALSLEPGTAQHWLVRGRVRHLLGEHRQAIEDLDQAVLFAPDLAQPHLLRARCRGELSDLDGARADLDRAVALDPRASEPLLNRAQLHLLRRDAGRALEDSTRGLELDPRRVELLVVRARARLLGGDPAGARADLTRALELEPGHPEARELVVEAGGTAPPQAAAPEGDAPADERSARAWVERGAASFQRRDWPGAITAFERAVAIAPDSADLHANLGVARMESGDLAGAVAALSSAIGLDPRSARAHQNRGQARAKGGDHRGALVDFDRALELDPRYALAYRERGKSRRSLDDAAGALADFDRALDLAPNDVTVHLARGDLRARQGDVAGALADLRTFCARAPTHRDAPAARRRIAELEARR